MNELQLTCTILILLVFYAKEKNHCSRELYGWRQGVVHRMDGEASC